METALRSIGRGVGHTHGCLRALGKAEEESRGRRREEILWPRCDSLKTTAYTHTHMQRQLPLSVFLRMHLFSPLYTAPFGPMCVWEVRTSVTAHWERVTAFYIYPETHRVMERRGRRSEKFWAPKALRSRGGERGSLDWKKWTKARGVDSCQF